MSSSSYSLGQKELLEAAFAHSGEGMVLTDPGSTILAVNAAFCQMSGYECGALIGQNPSLMQSGFHSAAFYHRMWNNVKKNGYWQGEIWDRKKNGEITPRQLKINAIRDNKDNVIFYLGLMTDHAELAAMTRLANQDALTGLANRRLFEKRVEHDLAYARRHKKQFALLYIDLDRFKHVNDSCGHRIGDALLIQVAERLRASTRAEDTVARLGGDEFIILLSDIKSRSDCEQVAHKVIQKINQPFTFNHHQVTLGCSIGLSIYPASSESLDELIDAADCAMYRAKENGRNTLCSS